MKPAGLTRFTLSLGVEGRVQFGDANAAGTFMGTDIVLALDEDETIGCFAELMIDHKTAANLTFFAAA